MEYELNTMGVGTKAIDGTVVMISGPNYPFGKYMALDVYRLRYNSRYPMSNMATIRLDTPAIPFTKQEFAQVNPWYNECGIDAFYSKQAIISDYEDMPVDCLSVTFGIKNKFCVGQEVEQGKVVGAVLPSHYEKSLKSHDWSSWDKFGDWRVNPVYSIELREPTFRFTMEEFTKFYAEDLKYFTDSYIEELYYRQDKDLYLSLPEDAISE